MIATSSAAGAATASSARAQTAILVGSCDVQLWSLPQPERLRRVFARNGLQDIRTADAATAGPAILVRTDFLLEESLIKALVETPDTLLIATADSGRSVAVAAHVAGERAGEVAGLLSRDATSAADAASLGLEVVGPDELGQVYNQALRRRADLYALSLREHPALAVEKRMFRNAYKGVTDFVTKWLWPWPAFWATRWCAAQRISPNLVTALSLVFVLAALWLFAEGYFVTGLVAAWLMTFLDTVDGKLARVTLTSSKFGNIFDHGIDLLHPPFWYLAWFYGLARGAPTGQMLLLAGAVWTAVIGYGIGRLQEGFFLWRFGFEMHAWRRLDSVFRLFTARRNPNLALLTIGVADGRPDLGLYAVAVWTVLSLLFHFARIGQAMQQRRSGRPVESWLAETASSA